MIKKLTDWIVYTVWYDTIRRWLLDHTQPRTLQIVGYITSVSGYVLLLLLHFVWGMSLQQINEVPWLGEALWIVVGLFAGVSELILLFVWKTHITAYGRGLFKKSVDRILLLGCIPLTWAAFGPIAAMIHFIGTLLSHYGETQE